jgi:putative flippase GtrA
MSRSGWRARARAAAASDHVLMRAMRFGMVGVMSGLVFAGITALCISSFGIGHKLASALGYLGSLPLNFIANRSFSFRSSNALSGDAARFLALHVGNLLVTTFAMGAVVDFLRLHYAVGIAAAIVLVPCVNFAVMQLWVFRAEGSR